MNRPLFILMAVAVAATAAPPAMAQQVRGSAPNAGANATRQGENGEIRGSVVDDAGAPVATASVAVMSRADSSLVTGAVVGRGGTFQLKGLTPGSYYLRVSAVGFTPRNTGEVAIAAASPRANVGKVRLERSALVIEGISVQGERHAVSIAPDRNSYSTKDLAQAGGTATDVLRSVPSVQVDGDGKVSLRGNENVAVQINGRPTPIRGDQLAAYLQQLPGNMVDRVEVVPNPSAKYDPEGMAGIINIVMKQNVDLGLSGGFMAGYGTGGRYSASGNGGYQEGPLTLLVNYGFNDEQRATLGANDRTYHLPTSTLAFRGQDVSGEMDQGGHNLSANVDYRLSDRDVLSTAVMANIRGFSDFTTSAYRDLGPSGAILGRYDRLSEAGSDDDMLDYTLAFKRTLEPQRHEIATEVRLNRSGTDSRNEFSRRAVSLTDGLDATLTDQERTATDALTNALTLQADYTRPLAERSKLETGYKGTMRGLDNDYEAFTLADGGADWTSDLGRSNSFEFDERVHAVYGVVSHGIGKFDLQAGLRAERATTAFHLENTGESFDDRYNSLFPSGILAYNMSDKQQLKLSYSRRIRRPDSRQLNPFPFYMDPQNVMKGNPELKPEYTDALELAFQHSGQVGTLQVSPFYRRTTDIMRFIVEVGDTLGGQEVTSVSFKNLATSTSWGSDVNGSVKVGKKFNGLGSLNLYKMVTNGGDVQSALSSDAVIWSARVNGTFALSPKLDLQAMYFYRAPMKFERGRFSSFSMSNVSLRRKLNGDRSSISVRVMDPFDTMGFRVEIGDDRITQKTHRTFGARALYINLQHSVGSTPRVRQRPQQPADQPQPGFGM